MFTGKESVDEQKIQFSTKQKIETSTQCKSRFLEIQYHFQELGNFVVNASQKVLLITKYQLTIRTRDGNFKEVTPQKFPKGLNRWSLFWRHFSFQLSC